MDGALPNREKSVTAEPSVLRPSFEEVFASHYDWVRHTVRRLGVAERDADDLTHDVMVTVLRVLPDYDAQRPIRPWLMGIAFRVTSTHRRSARVRREVVDLPVEPADASPDPHASLEAADRRRLLLDALTEVDESRRPVLLLSDLDGFSMPEIAAELGIPLNTGYSRLRLAREELRSALRRRMKEGA
jgi:RNA polymerase sigma-70 factor (ECF subfamily)